MVEGGIGASSRARWEVGGNSSMGWSDHSRHQGLRVPSAGK